MPAKFTFIDLFAGIGGFHLALKGLGGECVMAVERDETCRAVYRASFGKKFDEDGNFLRDIRSITLDRNGDYASSARIRQIVPRHDVLCAGFPCQPFSKSGSQLGVKDRTRGTLFYDIMSIVEARKPSAVLLENVRNIAGPRHRETWSDIIASLRNAGYKVSEEPLILSPHRLHPNDGGRPQARDRVFICAFQSQTKIKNPPLVASDLNLKSWDPNLWEIEKVLDPDESITDLDRYQVDSDELAAINAWQWFVRNVKDADLPGFPIWSQEFGQSYEIDHLPEWKQTFIRKNREFYEESISRKEVLDRWLSRSWGGGSEKLNIREFTASRQKFEWQARQFQSTFESRDLRKLLLQFRPSGIRVRPATYAPALVAITQTTIVGSRMRRLTPVEAGRLQGFDNPSFKIAGVSDSHAYRQLGNAVNVGVARVAAKPLLRKAGVI